MVNVRPILDKVWSELRKASVVDDIDIVEYIAALLTEDEAWTLPKELQPQKVSVRYNPNDISLKNMLEQAASEIDPKDLQRGKALLFDQHVLFYSSKTRDKGSYPTPRHIIDFMLHILQVKPKHSFADFACGSGSFLVHRHTGANTGSRRVRGQSVGVDISPVWGRIAGTNLALHQMTNVNIRIHIGDAFRLYRPDAGEFLSTQSFDRIAISPPLGALIELQPERNALVADMGSADMSDTLFTWLLQEKLQPLGKGAIVVSSQTLSSGKGNVLPLRTLLVTNHELQAVIGLPEDTFGPFIKKRNYKPYILLISKMQQGQIWFFETKNHRASRLSGEEKEREATSDINDLAFIQATISLTGNEASFEKVNEAFSKQYIKQEAGIQLGVVIKFQQNVVIKSITIVPDTFSTWLIIDAEIDGKALEKEKFVLQAEEHNFYTKIGDDPKSFSMSNSPRSNITVTNIQPEQLIAITNDGRLLGMTQSTAKVVEAHYNLLPETYLKPGAEKSNTVSDVYVDSPLRVKYENFIQPEIPISSKHESQLQLASETGIAEALPLFKPYQPPPNLIPILGTQQQHIWSLILQLDETNTYSMYFTEKQFVQQQSLADIRASFDLFERMGLIRQVTLRRKATGRIETYYRRINEQEAKNNTGGDVQKIQSKP